jgi:uncharacterized protein YjcR
VRPTLKDLASKYKVSFGYIQQVSQRDGWVKQSKIYTRSVEDKLRAGKIEAFAKEQASFDLLSHLVMRLRYCRAYNSLLLWH